MANVYVTQPQDRIIKTRNGNMLVKWNPNFASLRNTRYNRAQRVVDSRVLYYSENYIPVDTGELLLSGRRETKIGSGMVIWKARGRPYTRPQYYGWRRAHKSNLPKIHHGNYWFRKVKAQHGKQIVNKAKTMAGGGSGL